MHIVIRADGSSNIGYGHLMRSSSLAEELLKRGHTVTIATKTPDSTRNVFPNSSKIITLPSREDPDSLLQNIREIIPDLVFTDAYPVDTDYQRAVRDEFPLTVLQDDARHAVCADVFVNGNLYAADLNYEFVGEPPQTCLGTDYVLLRHEIRKRAVDDPPWREDPERAIITMGGSDMQNLTPTIVHAFDGSDLRVDAIVGPGFSENQEREIQTAAESVSVDVRVARNPDDLSDRMFQADFAVSTASSTTYELLALGTPIVSIPVADNQEPIANTLRERNIATVIKPEITKEAVQDPIKEYITDLSLRKERRNYGRKLVDGEGVYRITNEIESVSQEYP